MRIPDHLTCLLKNLYARQEATVRTGHGTVDWFQIGKGIYWLYTVRVVYCQLAYLTYMQSKSCKMLDWMKYKLESRNINNLRYADDITLMAEREEELKSLLMKVKEECEKASLKSNIKKKKNKKN